MSYPRSDPTLEVADGYVTVKSCMQLTKEWSQDSEREFMKVRDLIKNMEEDGWYLARTSGSHRQFKHPTKAGTVTVAGKPGVDIPQGTLSAILKQSGLKK